MKEYSIKRLIALRSLAILMITIVLIALLVIIPLNKFLDNQIYNLMEDTAQESIISLVKQFDKSLVTMGEAYNPALRRLLEDYAERLEPVEDDSLVHGRLLSELEAVKKEVQIPDGLQTGKLRFYLINLQGKVVDTNYPSALGVNLTEFPKLWANLKELKPGKLLVQRLTYSRYTNQPRKYGYIKLTNGYLLELGINLAAKPIKELSLDLKNLQEELRFVENLEIYNEQFEPLGNAFLSLPTNADKKEFSQLLEKEEKKKKVVTDAGEAKVYTYWQSKFEKQISEPQKYLIKIDFDFAQITTFKKILWGLIIGLTLVVSILITYFSNNLYQKLITPFSRLTQEMQKLSLEEISQLNLEIPRTDIKEVNTLLATYQNLASELSASLEEMEAMNEELEESYAELEKVNQRLEKLLEMPGKIGGTVFGEEEEFLSQLLTVALDLIPEADYGSIYISEGEEWEFIDTVGHDLEALQALPLQADYIPEFEGGTFLAANDILEYSKGKMPREVFEKFAEASKPIKSTILAKLEVGNEEIGALNLDIPADSEQEFSRETLKTIDYFSNVASAFATMQRYHQMQEKFQKEIILSIINILELHDKYTKGHSENVADISATIARELGFTQEKVNQVYWAGLVHDIGKILVDRNILNKPGKLTRDEYNEIKQHSVWGYKVLSNSEELEPIAKNIKHHHEWWDGSGYPDGLQGEKIPRVSRIIGVADAWDTMRSNRVYRNKLSKGNAIQELKEGKGVQFDPEIVEIMLQLISQGKV